MKDKQDYQVGKPTWCRGCGLFGILEALKRAAAALNLEPENMVMVTGIGCHGRMNSYFRAYGFHGLHGRVLPLASGIKLANPGLTVLGVSGDGDAYSIGLGHLIHALRRNIGLTLVVADNRIYGLTQGQTSPTSGLGFSSISTPFGSKEYPLNGLKLALASGGTFISRGFSGEVGHLAGLIKMAVGHRGFSLVEVLSPCVTHNAVNTYHWFRSRLLNVEEEPGYDPSDRAKAWSLLDREDRLPVGLVFRQEKASYEEMALEGFDLPLAAADLRPDTARLEIIMEKFR
jgi:2-oxoglutarate ferredoxin oxidoreductase subunit beta